MSAFQRNVVAVFLAAVVLVLALFAFINIVHAQANSVTSANAQCVPAKDYTRACGTPPDQQHPLTGGLNCPCGQAEAGGSQQGICLAALKCQSVSASGLNGGNAQSGLDQLGKTLGQLLQSLMQQSQQSPQSSPTTGATGCTTSYYYTSNASLPASDPCALYQAGTTCTDPTATNYGAAASCTYGTSTTSASSLLSALTGSATSIGTNGDTLAASPASGSSPLSVTFTATIQSTDNASTASLTSTTVTPGDGGNSVILSVTGGGATSGSIVETGTYTYATAGTYNATLMDSSGDTLAGTTVSVTNPGTGSSQSPGLSQVLSNVGNFLTNNSSSTLSGETSGNFPGVFGNILLNNGATIFASTINPANNSEVSGFYGSGTLGSQPQGMAGQLCVNRPWASNVLADIIPPSFFDSLCQWGGYQVGTPPPAQQPQVTIQQTRPAPQPTTTVATSTTPTVPAQAEIWAVPAEVPLGSRTSVYWNTQGVSSCTESSPDGSFSENSLSGAASTVPLTGSTTFTISCLDPNNNPVTDYVTVTISS